MTRLSTNFGHTYLVCRMRGPHSRVLRRYCPTLKKRHVDVVVHLKGRWTISPQISITIHFLGSSQQVSPNTKGTPERGHSSHIVEVGFG
jgi:hypothetical protein